jgi:hypothetical protein
METVLTGISSWMPYAPQGVKGPDDDEHNKFSEWVDRLG